MTTTNVLHQMTATERENRQQSEMLSAYAADKDNLESALYESQQTVRELEVRRAQLEGENQELIVKKENLQGKYNHQISGFIFTFFLVTNITIIYIYNCL